MLYSLPNHGHPIRPLVLRDTSLDLILATISRDDHTLLKDQTNLRILLLYYSILQTIHIFTIHYAKAVTSSVTHASYY